MQCMLIIYWKVISKISVSCDWDLHESLRNESGIHGKFYLFFCLTIFLSKIFDFRPHQTYRHKILKNATDHFIILCWCFVFLFCLLFLLLTWIGSWNCCNCWNIAFVFYICSNHEQGQHHFPLTMNQVDVLIMQHKIMWTLNEPHNTDDTNHIINIDSPFSDRLSSVSLSWF